MSSATAGRESDSPGQIQHGLSRASDAGRIPSPRTSFVGRETAVSAVRLLTLDQSSRLVTVVGPGGVGKTRVAIEAAKAVQGLFPVGAWFVSLAAIQHPRFMVDAIAQALSVKPAGAGDALTALEAFLGGGRALLVLDSMEHLPGAAIDIDRMLANCPGLVVLATSRAPLRLSGEKIYGLDPMTLPLAGKTIAVEELLDSEAGRLFIERAQSAHTGSSFSDSEARAIAEICVRLDGLPLAIELAASRTRILTLASLLTQLDHRLRLLTAGPRDAPARQQTLLDTIAWSYDLLPERQQSLFRRLAISIGGFTFAAADALSGNAPLKLHSYCDEVFEDVSSLVDNSLVIRISGPGDEPRFSMLETIREFGLAKLQSHGETAGVSARHATFYQVLAHWLRPQIEGKEGLLTLSIFEVEHPNLREALSWYLDHQDGEPAVRLTRDLWKFWWVRQYVTEGRGWMRRTLELANELKLAGTPEILYAAGSAALGQGDAAEATRLAQLAVDVATECDDRFWRTNTFYLQGHIARYHGDYDRARAFWLEGLQRSRDRANNSETDDHWAAMILNALSETDYRQGNYEQALEYCEEAHAIWEAREDPWGIARSLSSMAMLAAASGDSRRALDDYRESLLINQKLGDPRAIAIALSGIATLAVHAGHHALALRLFGAMLETIRSVGADRSQLVEVEEERAMITARAAVGEKFADLALQEGQQLSQQQAISEAMGLKLELSPKSRHSRTGGDLTLTGREMDVLRQIISGATDQQIADSLFIARRTVSTHVTNILAKLNVENRTAAAALATRTGLV